MLKGLKLISMILLFLNPLAGCYSIPTDYPTPQITELAPTPTTTPFHFNITTTPGPAGNDTGGLLPTPTPLNLEHYVHPGGSFELNYPAGWSIQQGAASASFNDPDGKASIHVYVLNTEYMLDKVSFLQLVKARDDNLFGTYSDYLEIDRDDNKVRNSILTVKQITEDSVPRVVVSIYRQVGQVVFVLDYWMDRDITSYKETPYSLIVESLKPNPSAVENLLPSITPNNFTYQNGYFSFEIPAFWKFVHTSEENSVVDTFYSPDQHVVVQAISYADGLPISKSALGNFVLYLLGEIYVTDIKDITITKDEIIMDGRERLSWYSKSAGYQGVTDFETRKGELIVLTILHDTSHIGYYQDVIDNILASYIRLPQP